LIFNNTQKLLAGSLALVLVAGMTSPAFAGFPCDFTSQSDGEWNSVFSGIPTGVDGVCIQHDVTIDGVAISSDIGVNGGSLSIGCNGELTVDSDLIIVTLLTNHGSVNTGFLGVEPNGLVENSSSLIFDDSVNLGEIVIISSICDKQVAGELLPFDSSALMIAGLTSMTVWMVPAVAGLAGVGVYLIKSRANKD